jgi:hypothetical protein
MKMIRRIAATFTVSMIGLCPIAAADPSPPPPPPNRPCVQAEPCLGDVSQQDQEKLQESTDQKSKIEDGISNVLKGQQETQNNITQNMK